MASAVIFQQTHLHRYLSQFDFRYSNRAKLGVTDEMRTDKVLSQVAGKRLTYRRPHSAYLKQKAARFLRWRKRKCGL